MCSFTISYACLYFTILISILWICVCSCWNVLSWHVRRSVATWSTPSFCYPCPHPTILLFGNDIVYFHHKIIKFYSIFFSNECCVFYRKLIMANFFCVYLIFSFISYTQFSETLNFQTFIFQKFTFIFMRYLSLFLIISSSLCFWNTTSKCPIRVRFVEVGPTLFWDCVL